MVSPRYDYWHVSADKPEDHARFDRLVPQPFQDVSRGLGYGGGGRERVYETFATEAEARRFAARIQMCGATNIHVAAPRDGSTSRSGPRRITDR